MKPEQHVRAAIQEFVDEGSNPENLDPILKTFASAIGGLLGCLQASSQGDISDELTERRIDDICEYMKCCAKEVSKNVVISSLTLTH